MKIRGAGGQESRRSLLSAAAEEFALTGYYQTKVSSIAARAGLTQPDFYLHFHSKDEVFAECIETFRSQLNALVEGKIIEPGKNRTEVLAQVQSWLEKLFRFLSEHPPLTRIGFYQAADSVRIKAEMVVHMEKNVMAAQREGYYREDLDAGLTAECLVGTIERLTLTKLLPGRESPSDLAKHILQLWIEGMLVHERFASL